MFKRFKYKRLKYISSEEDLYDFLENYHAISGNTINIEELSRRTHVCALYDDNNKMCAGFTVNCQTPLVYISDLPQQVSSHFLYNINNDIVETGSIWFKNEVSSFMRGFFFLEATWKAYKTKKRYYMVGSRNSKIARRQKSMFPNIVFEGKTSQFDYICILYCRREYMLVQIGLISLRYWLVQPIKNWMNRVKGITFKLSPK